jgi:hypothetical protein
MGRLPALPADNRLANLTPMFLSLKIIIEKATILLHNCYYCSLSVEEQKK